MEETETETYHCEVETSPRPVRFPQTLAPPTDKNKSNSKIELRYVNHIRLIKQKYKYLRKHIRPVDLENIYSLTDGSCERK